MKNINKIVAFLCFGIFYANFSSASTVEIAITGGGDEKIKNLTFANAEMKCSGRNSSYYIDKIENNHLYVTSSQFSDDPRDTCKLPDDNVYFILHNIIIDFDYEGKRQECILAADLGTSYDHLGFHYDKLQSYIIGNPWGSKELKEAPAACIGNPGFIYKIIQGTHEPFVGYDKGHIEISHVDSPRVSDAGIVWTLFINGIANSIDDAMISSLTMSQAAPHSDGTNLQYGLLYNRSHGAFRDSIDLAQMKLFDGYIAEEKYLNVYEQTTGIYCTSVECKQRALDWYLTMTYTEVGFSNFAPEEIFGHDFDSVWNGFISKGIYPTDKVLFVSHSQGNLYANVLTDYLKYAHKFPANNLNTLHIGVTSARLSTNYNTSTLGKLFPRTKLPDYITNVEDHIINVWRANVAQLLILFPGKFTEKILPKSGNLSYDNEARINSNLSDIMNHGFVEAYLNHRSTLAAYSNMLYKNIAAEEYELSSQHVGNSGVSIFKIEDHPEGGAGFGNYQFSIGSVSNKNIDIYPPSGGNKGGMVGRTIFSNEGCQLCSRVTAISPSSIEKGYYQIFTSPDYSYLITAHKPYDTIFCGHDTFEMKVEATQYEVTCGSTKKIVTGVINSNMFRFAFYKDSVIDHPSNVNIFYAFTFWDYELISDLKYNIPIVIQFSRGLSYKLDLNPSFENWHPSLNEDGLGGVFEFKTDWLIDTINAYHATLCQYDMYTARLRCPITISHYDTKVNLELSSIVPFGKYSTSSPLNLTRANVSITEGASNYDIYYRKMFSTYAGRPAAPDELYIGFVEADDN